MNNYYEKNAKEYIDKTQNANMQHEYDEFLKHIPKGGTILDLGCGSSRDALSFKNMGYEVYCMDIVKDFCNNAISKGINPQNVFNMSILDFNESTQFDGIWACASLLHLNRIELKNALKIIHSALKSDGCLYTSFKYGDFEGMRDERYYLDLTQESFESYLNETKLKLVNSWVQEDKLSRGNKWINFIVKNKKPEKYNKHKLAEEHVYEARMVKDFNLYTAQEVFDNKFESEEFITPDGKYSLRYVSPYERKGRKDKNSDGNDKPRVKVSGFFRKMISLHDHHDLYPIDKRLKKTEHKIHERESEWHNEWKERVKDFCEIEKRFYLDDIPSRKEYKIADAYYADTNTVIEFQKAFADEALSKSTFYKRKNLRLIWVFYLPTLGVFKDEDSYKIREDNYYHFFRIEGLMPDFYKNNFIFLQDKNDRIYYVEQLKRVESNNELEGTIRFFKIGLSFDNPDSFAKWLRFDWLNSEYFKKNTNNDELSSVIEILSDFEGKPEKMFFLQNATKNDINGNPLIYCFIKDNGVIRTNYKGLISYRCYINQEGYYRVNKNWEPTVQKSNAKKWILLATNMKKYHDLIAI